MKLKTPDKSWEHLYPPFREKLRKVLHEASQDTGEEFVLIEGYRSHERQTALYAQGRTQPGQIVTWLKTPLLHGAGLAADCIPKRLGYKADMGYWNAYRRIYTQHGLGNTAWGKGDMTHVELNDAATRARALVWVRNGFKDLPPPAPPPAGHISVLVDGQPVEDAGAYLEDGCAWVKLRPVTDGLDLVITAVTGKGANRSVSLVDDDREWIVAATLKGGRAFVRAVDLAGSAGPAVVYWDGEGRCLSITTRRTP